MARIIFVRREYEPLTCVYAMVAQLGRQAGDVIERVEVVHALMQPVHAILVTRSARQ